MHKLACFPNITSWTREEQGNPTSTSPNLLHNHSNSCATTSAYLCKYYKLLDAIFALKSTQDLFPKHRTEQRIMAPEPALRASRKPRENQYIFDLGVKGRQANSRPGLCAQLTSSQENRTHTTGYWYSR